MATRPRRLHGLFLHSGSGRVWPNSPPARRVQGPPARVPRRTHHGPGSESQHLCGPPADTQSARSSALGKVHAAASLPRRRRWVSARASGPRSPRHRRRPVEAARRPPTASGGRRAGAPGSRILGAGPPAGCGPGPLAASAGRGHSAGPGWPGAGPRAQLVVERPREAVGPRKRGKKGCCPARRPTSKCYLSCWRQ